MLRNYSSPIFLKRSFLVGKFKKSWVLENYQGLHSDLTFSVTEEVHLTKMISINVNVGYEVLS